MNVSPNASSHYWSKAPFPGTSHGKSRPDLPRNLVTQKPYRGINPFLLMAMGYESPHWLTFRQASQLGGSVKKGEKACPVVFWKQMEIDGQGIGRDRRKFRCSAMYYRLQHRPMRRLEERCQPRTRAPLSRPRPDGDRGGICRSRPLIKHGMTHARYSPAERFASECPNRSGSTPRTAITPPCFTSWFIPPAMKSG